MLHSVLLSSASQALPAQVAPAQIPLAASTLVAADPTGLEWLLLIAAPIVFLVLYLVCLFVVAVFGPTVMKNNKTGGATYLLDRPSRVAFRTRTVALFALVGAFVELIWLGYTGRVGSIAVIPILLFTWSWKFAFFFLPLQLIRAWYVHATRGKYDALSAEGAQRREKLNRKSAYEVSKMMQRNPQQFAMSKELHTQARAQKIAGMRPFQHLDEAGKKRRANYTVELALAQMQVRQMNPGKLPSEAFGEGILGMGLGIRSERAVEQTWLTLCTERVNAVDAPNYPDSLYPVSARFSLFTTMSLLQPLMGRPYSPFTAEDARRFVPRDFSADTVLLKTEELGKKTLAQSAIFRQIHERLLPLHQQQPQLVDRRALAYCGALLLSVAKAEAESQRLTSQVLAAAASERGILSYGLFSQISEDYQRVQRLLNLMVKATADIERFINAVEGLVQMHSGPVQPSGISYEKAQMEYIAALLDVIVFSSHAPLAGSIQASYALLKADYGAFTFNTSDELSRSYWLQYSKNAVSACDTGLSQGYEGFFGSDDAARKAWESYAEDVVKEVCTYSVTQVYWDALVQQALIQRDLPREFSDASSAVPELMNKNAAASFPTYYINLIWN
ncbi:geranylgeranyl pyrophosphate synthase [Rothia mucilaginosa]